MGSLRGEAPHKLQVGGRAKPYPPNAPKAPEGVQSTQGEVVGDQLPGGEVLEIEKISKQTQNIQAQNTKSFKKIVLGLNWVPVAPFGALLGQK